ncbi:RNA polymerase factor sigma-54 [Anaeromyxobacter dehalogenans]|uniref:RNA polymerase, sigma 54 subunit, RpoN/SigL n=1 Tax=Anaeromyxobacter dehalogenans (strain 2CP-C) TaxID=290397 RepID=Q2IH71_ANADE|nr:RNA polymerase factor sigma-54 [Anaeromyxobacter dehalogenans]ABC83931.1 RNA polymerase, sigma 54 subunit, RpoN/SigL [Anaeromyxobacter dehalogenans 2CP-C]
MSLELKQHLKMTQQLVMTPQLQQAIKLLQLSRMELVDLIRTEMTENPMLEGADENDEQAVPDGASPAEQAEIEAKPEHKEAEKAEEVKGEEGANEIDWDQYLDQYQLQGHTAPSNRGLSDEEMPGYEATLTKKTDLVDHLVWQLRLSNFTPEEEQVAMLIIGNLDDDGYFKMPAVEGEADEATSRDPLVRVAFESGQGIEVAERVLRKVQTFDPLGVAARNLRECLMIQVDALNADTPEIVAIIERHLKHLESKNYQAIAKDLKVPIEEVVKAVKVISRLEPKPGRAYSGEEAQYITPDVYVHKMGDKYVTVLNDDGLSKLRISGMYRAALKNGEAGKAKEYIQEKLRSAVWLIRSIHQRQRTIYKVTESIVKFQRDFLDKGIAHLKPLILRDVAEDIGMHESTVSRVTTNKYVHTPQGIYELKFFFNSAIQKTGGDEIASEAVKNHIRQIVAAEDPKHPHSDQKIVELLKGQNIEIARRTVAKYREVLGILPSSKRKKYF